MRAHLAIATLGMFCLSCLSGPSPVVQDPKKPFELPAGTYPVKDVLLKCSTYLGRNLLVDENDFANPENTITLQKSVRVSEKGCEELQAQLAYSKGFAIVPMDPSKKLYWAIFSRGPKRPEIMANALFLTAAQVRQRANLAVYVRTVRTVKHISASKASATIRPFLASSGSSQGGVQLGYGGTEHAILLQGYCHQVAAVLRLIDEIDKPGELKLDQHINQRFSNMQSQINSLSRQVQSLKKQLAPKKK